GVLSAVVQPDPVGAGRCGGGAPGSGAGGSDGVAVCGRASATAGPARARAGGPAPGGGRATVDGGAVAAALAPAVRRPMDRALAQEHGQKTQTVGAHEWQARPYLDLPHLGRIPSP